MSTESKQKVLLAVFLICLLGFFAGVLFYQMKKIENYNNKKKEFYSTEIYFDNEVPNLHREEKGTKLYKTTNSFIASNFAISSGVFKTKTDIICQSNGAKFIAFDKTVTDSDVRHSSAIEIIVDGDKHFEVYAFKVSANGNYMAKLTDEMYTSLFKSMWYSYETKAFTYKVEYRSFIRLNQDNKSICNIKE